MTTNEFLLSAPVLLISFFAISAILLDALIKYSTRVTFIYTTVGLLITAIAAAVTIPTKGYAYANMITVGGYAAFFDVIFCIAALLTVIAARPYLESQDFEHDEFYSLVLFCVGGMILISHAANMLVLFIGVEVMSVLFYVLAGYFRSTVRSVEAALKYFLLGAFSTGFMLYGMALLYGSTGTLNIAEINTAVQGTIEFPLLLVIGIGLLIIGLSFKIAAFPFHQWVPDVYEGAPTVVTGFMSTAGKAAALSAFIPIITALMPANQYKIQMLLALIAGATMLVGNITAISQSNVKRMLAYSSIAHAGYLMMGLVANNTQGWSGMLYYSAAYMFMQIGAFVVVSIIEKDTDKNLTFSDYAGLSKDHPVLSALMAIFMFSLAGIPPFAGFFGKYVLFSATVDAGFTWLAIVAVISSIISVYFYIGLVVVMYFKDKEAGEPIIASSGLAGITLIVATAGTFILGFLPQFLDAVTKSLF
ncbi:MAG TPA: NADH-quinone oxidoreductase subunit N [Patescibacteria group bacterium]|nr:NADH-quinone oxidoreductase subunit N [Patescibacteria group bacterium]